MAVITDRGFHCTSYGYAQLADVINVGCGSEESQLQATLLTYATFYGTAMKEGSDFRVVDVVGCISEVAKQTCKTTVPLYTAQWLLHKVETGTEESDLLLRNWMSASAILDLVGYVETGDCDTESLGKLTTHVADKLLDIRLPMRNFLEQMQKSISFDIHSSSRAGDRSPLL